MRLLGMILVFVACASSAPPPATAPAPAAVAPAPTAPAATPAPAPAEDANRSLTRAECNEAVDHVTAMPDDTAQAKQAISMIKENRDTFIDQCVATAKKKDFDCLMSKKTFPDLATCPQPGQ
jgi:hypothetical protein